MYNTKKITKDLFWVGAMIEDYHYLRVYILCLSEFHTTHIY